MWTLQAWAISICSAAAFRFVCINKVPWWLPGKCIQDLCYLAILAINPLDSWDTWTCLGLSRSLLLFVTSRCSGPSFSLHHLPRTAVTKHSLHFPHTIKRLNTVCSTDTHRYITWELHMYCIAVIWRWQPQCSLETYAVFDVLIDRLEYFMAWWSSSLEEEFSAISTVFCWNSPWQIRSSCRQTRWYASYLHKYNVAKKTVWLIWV